MPCRLHNLDYGLSRPRHRLVWSAAILGLLLATAVAIPLIGPLSRYTRSRRLWRNCSEFRPQGESVAYANVPRPAAKVGASPGHTVVAGEDRLSITTRPPNCWSEMENLEFGRVYPDAMLYLGERRSPSGHERLVAIELPAYPPDYVGFPSLISRFVIRPPTLDRAAPVATGIESAPGDARNELPRGEDPFVIYLGHNDSADESKFLIPYRLGNQKGLMVGRLTDQDTIVLDFDSGPGRDD